MPQVQCPNCEKYLVVKKGQGVLSGCTGGLLGLVFVLALGVALLAQAGGYSGMWLIVILVLGLVLLLRFSIQSQPWECKSCGYEWKEDKKEDKGQTA